MSVEPQLRLHTWLLETSDIPMRRAQQTDYGAMTPEMYELVSVHGVVVARGLAP
jgi:hypothetical protein